MELKDLVDYCAAKPEAQLAFPFGDKPICFKYRGRIFIEIYPDEGDRKITVRCDPGVGAYLREQHPDTIIPGYHVPLRQRKFKNTVLLDGKLDDAELRSLIDHSYSTLAE